MNRIWRGREDTESKDEQDSSIVSIRPAFCRLKIISCCPANSAKCRILIIIKC